MSGETPEDREKILSVQLGCGIGMRPRRTRLFQLIIADCMLMLVCLASYHVSRMTMTAT